MHHAADSPTQARTLGQLRAAGWRPRSVKDELRANLLARMAAGREPTRRTIAETLREVQRCTKEGITINTFMLERSRALPDFVTQMTRLNRGRAFYATPERLGEYVLVDFVNRRTKRVT